MPKTTPTGRQIRDGSVQRDDLDVSTVGQSVPTKIVAGSGITISQTGADSGTGDVTINAELSAIQKAAGRIVGLARDSVPGTGVLFLGHDDAIPHTLVPVVIPSNSTIVAADISVEEEDILRSYELVLYSDLRNTPVFEAVLTTLAANDVSGSNGSLSVPITAGEYGFGVRRASGASAPSAFSTILGNVFIVEQ